jgi:septum formation protein
MLVLASASPARAQLLRDAGFAFVVEVSHARELSGRGRSLDEAAIENARRKGAIVARRHPDDWVLSADTMITLDGRFYGKAKNLADGVHTLLKFAGRTHELATGVVLRRGVRVIEKIVRSRVSMRPNDRAAIERVCRRRDPRRFAGGYAIQEQDDPLVTRVDGSFSNVVGLPMEVVTPLLRRVLR